MAGDYVCDDVPFIVLVDSNHVSSNEANFCHFLRMKPLCLLKIHVFDILRALDVKSSEVTSWCVNPNKKRLVLY